MVDAETALPALPGDGPWIVKAQVPVGGRGKAGGVVLCRTREEATEAVQRMIGTSMPRHVVRACLIEADGSGHRGLSVACPSMRRTVPFV